MKLLNLALALGLAGALAACGGPDPRLRGPVPVAKPVTATISHSARTIYLKGEGAAPAQAAPASAEVPPAPQPEPPARDYLVFFDFDESAIRSDSAAILVQVISAAHALDASALSLIGHADRAGTIDYNQRLSVGRAESVRRFMADRGVPGGMISIEGKGETDPRVPTPDGVREAENRRVEIRLQ